MDTNGRPSAGDSLARQLGEVLAALIDERLRLALAANPSGRADPQLLLTIPQAAERLAVSPGTVKNMIRDQELTAIHPVPGSTRIAAAELHEWVERRRRGGPRGASRGGSRSPSPVKAKARPARVDRGFDWHEPET